MATSVAEISPSHASEHLVCLPYPFAMMYHWFHNAQWSLDTASHSLEHAVPADPDAAAMRETMLTALAQCTTMLDAALSLAQQAAIVADEQRLTADMTTPLRRRTRK
jgi:hypothetical protein